MQLKYFSVAVFLSEDPLKTLGEHTRELNNPKANARLAKEVAQTSRRKWGEKKKTVTKRQEGEGKSGEQRESRAKQSHRS